MKTHKKNQSVLHYDKFEDTRKSKKDREHNDRKNKNKQ